MAKFRAVDIAMAIDNELEPEKLARELADGAKKPAQRIITIAQLAGLVCFSIPLWFSYSQWQRSMRAYPPST
jgi:hypothetical protein